jgi:L-aminopeptidase/D-esterase-like protein
LTLFQLLLNWNAFGYKEQSFNINHSILGQAFKCKGVELTLIGKYNALTDVDGISVGHYTDEEAACGVTAVICAKGAVTGVDVRGSGPCTRETDLLAPARIVEHSQAVVLSGGSVYGLAAADGVVRWLAEKGFGFPLDKDQVAPIVPAAALYDLDRGSDFVPPISAEWGQKACRAAMDGEVACGCVGAGTGAWAGSIKGGLGTASQILDSGITTAALVAVNPDGEVIERSTGRPFEIRLEIEGEFGRQGRRAVILPQRPENKSGTNTVLGVIATDAMLTKAQVHKIAQMAHDGLARAIRPSHTLFEGDTIFCMATGKQKLPEISGYYGPIFARAVSDIGHAAANCLSRAIIRAILTAKSMAGMTAFCDLADL